MDVHLVIDEALVAYYKSGKRQPIHSPRMSYPGYVRASSLGGCPLAGARQKLGFAPDLPDLLPGGTVQSIITLQAGEYAAMLYQEALLHCSTVTEGISVEVEVDLSDHQRKVSGRADAVVNGAIIELKYTFEGKGVEPGEPRESHAWQLMTYARARYGKLDVMPEMYLVTIGKYAYKVYELRPDGEGYAFYDTTEDAPLDQGYGGWNQPANLNYDRLDETIDNAHEYMRWVKGYNTQMVSPIENPLTDPQGWLCLKSTKDYKKNTGTVTPNCAWALSCHGIRKESAISRNGSGSEWQLTAMKEQW